MEAREEEEQMIQVRVDVCHLLTWMQARGRRTRTAKWSVSAARGLGDWIKGGGGVIVMSTEGLQADGPAAAVA